MNLDLQAPETASDTGWRRIRIRDRISAALLCAVLSGVFAVAAVLVPDARGLGTHEQLGLGACPTLSLLHIPCAFCGMSTSFSLMIRGNVLSAILVQPAGALLFVIFIIVMTASVSFAIAGKMPSRIGTQLLSGRIVLASIGIVTVSWVYKIIVFVT